MSTSIAQNIEALCQEQGIDRELVVEAIKEAVRAAAKKQFKGGEDIQVDWSPESGLELSASKVVVDDVADPSTELSIEQARELGGDEVEIGDALLLPMPMEELGRIAAQTAKQILFQKVRDAVRSNVYEQYIDRVGELVIKPVEGSGGYGIVFGPDASNKELDVISKKIRSDPRGWIAQPVVQLSTVPTKVGQRLKPRQSSTASDPPNPFHHGEAHPDHAPK